MFVFKHVKDNKFKILRWKLLDWILPCKQILETWKIVDTSFCNICNVNENYEHFFITCKYLKKKWEGIRLILNKLKIGYHIISL